MSDEGVQIGPPARQRSHTLFFLDVIRPFAPVFLDTDVNMTGVLADRQAARDAGTRISVAAYVAVAGARVLARHPEANAAIQGKRRPQVARFTAVSAKIAVDGRIDGVRAVLAAVVPEPHTAGPAEVQRRIDRIRDGDPAELPELAGVRRIHALPWDQARKAFGKAAADLSLRPMLTGTFAVSSLGHRPVDGFYSNGGTTITLGVGRVAQRPVVDPDGRIVAAPVLRLSLTFDHRVIDGAEAADVLGEIRDELEGWAAPSPGDLDTDLAEEAGRPEPGLVPVPE